MTMPLMSITTVTKPVRLLRETEVLNIARVTRVHLYKLEAAGQFPKRIKISANRVGWLESEVASWLEGKMAERAA